MNIDKAIALIMKCKNRDEISDAIGDIYISNQGNHKFDWPKVINAIVEWKKIREHDSC